MKIEERIFEAISRLERHEAMCEERSKTIFNRLDAIDDGLDSINKTLLRGAGRPNLWDGGANSVAPLFTPVGASMYLS